MVNYIRNIIVINGQPTIVSMVDYYAPHKLRGTPQRKRRAKAGMGNHGKFKLFKGWRA